MQTSKSGMNNVSLAFILFLFLVSCYLIFKPRSDLIICSLPPQKFGSIGISSKEMVCGLKRCHFNEQFCKSPVVEKHVIKPLVLLSKILSPASIIDIGSNMGIFSIYSSELAPIVYSYDVQMDLNNLLAKSAEKYDNIKVKNCGLGLKPERGWTPDGFVHASGGLCDLKEVDFTNSIIKLDIDGNEEGVVSHILATSFLAMILEVTPSGWKFEPRLLKEHCDRCICFLTETDRSEELTAHTKMHKSSLLNYIDSSVVNSTVIDFLFRHRLVHNLIILNTFVAG